MSEKGIDSLFDYASKTCFRVYFTMTVARKRERECYCYSLFRLCGTGSKHTPGTRTVMWHTAAHTSSNTCQTRHEVTSWWGPRLKILSRPSSSKKLLASVCWRLLHTQPEHSMRATLLGRTVQKWHGLRTQVVKKERVDDRRARREDRRIQMLQGIKSETKNEGKTRSSAKSWWCTHTFPS
jgi:hypothetical protein